MLLATEFLKLILSSCLEQLNNVENLYSSLHRHVVNRPLDALKLLIPTVLYLVQNYLVYVSLTLVTVPLFQVIYQSKLLTTAALSVLFLKRTYSAVQWMCIVAITVGVTIVMLDGGRNEKNSSEEEAKNSLLGVLAVVVACLCSSTAGIYFERVIKQASFLPQGDDSIQKTSPVPQPSLWMRNIQMSFFTLCILIVQYLIKISSLSTRQPLFHGFTPWVWLQISLLGGGGLLVAAVVKYADSVQKGLATCVAVILSSGISMRMEQTPFSMSFLVGATLIVTACFLFGNPQFAVNPCRRTTITTTDDNKTFFTTTRVTFVLVVLCAVTSFQVEHVAMMLPSAMVDAVAKNTAESSGAHVHHNMTRDYSKGVTSPLLNIISNEEFAKWDNTTNVTALVTAEPYQNISAPKTGLSVTNTTKKEIKVTAKDQRKKGKAVADWILPKDHKRPSNSSRMSQLWPRYDTKMGPWEPVLHRRPSDGHPFLLTLIVEQVEWMDFAVNLIYSLRQQGIHNVTISTDSQVVISLCKKFGLAFYDATDVYKTVPYFFQPLPSWSWGKLAWLRVATTLHAIRQGVGSCHLDVDATISDDVFFSHPDGPFDATLQGQPRPNATGQSTCDLSWEIQHVTNSPSQFYINPGFGCFAANERTALLFDGWSRECDLAIKFKRHGWLQPAFNKAACHGDFRVNSCNGTLECQVELTKYNVSMLTFRSLQEEDSVGTPAHAVHMKGCHGAAQKRLRNGGDTLKDVTPHQFQNNRHKCKIEGLKRHNAWYVPFDLPMEAEGWENSTLIDMIDAWLSLQSK